MRITFIDPRGWQGAASGQVPYPNVGIAYIAGALLASGHDVSVIDLNNHALSDEEVLQSLRRQEPELVGLSVKTATAASARHLARLIRENGLDVPTIVGGPHTTLCGTELAEEPWFDGVVVGEGERSMVEVCRVLSAGGSLDDVDGLGTRSRVERGEVPRAVLDGDISELEFPVYDIFSPLVLERLQEAYPLVTSRGCVYKCTFCSVPAISGSRFRREDPERVVRELDLARERHGVRRFEVVDDIFNVNIVRCKEICRLLLEAGLGLDWSCPNGIRADRMDEELASLMRESGCDYVAIGVESGDEDVFAQVNKGESLADVRRGIGILRGAGMRVTGFFILGLPGDSFAATEKSVRFAIETGIQPHFNMLVPYQGTAIYEWARKNARLLCDPEEGLHFNDDPRRLEVTLETDDFTAEERKRAWEMAHFRLRQWERLIPTDAGRWERFFRTAGLYWRYERRGLPRYVLAKLGSGARRLLRGPGQVPLGEDPSHSPPQG